MLRFMNWRITLAATAAVAALSFSGCGDDDEDILQPEPMTAFALHFAAIHEGEEVGCGDRLTGFGATTSAEVEISDLRFYVSNIQFLDANGDEVPVELDQNEFQYVSTDGDVALIDLTGTASGACAGEGLTYAEGTARTNSVVTGMTRVGDVKRIAFDVGVPQRVQKRVIANNTAEDAPSPLRELHWSWGYAYRNFVMNFTILDGGIAGEGYLHVGSTECGGDGTRALTDRQTCGKPNAPAVVFSTFNLAADTVAVDIGELLASLDFRVAQNESTMVPGVACHSSSAQGDCPQIFDNLGIDIADGETNAALNAVFKTK